MVNVATDIYQDQLRKAAAVFAKGFTIIHTLEGDLEPDQPIN